MLPASKPVSSPVPFRAVTLKCDLLLLGQPLAGDRDANSWPHTGPGYALHGIGLPENRNIPQYTATHRNVTVCCGIFGCVAVWVILRYVAVYCGMLRFSGRPTWDHCLQSFCAVLCQRCPCLLVWKVTRFTRTEQYRLLILL
jgi:hypothetical protein